MSATPQTTSALTAGVTPASLAFNHAIRADSPSLLVPNGRERRAFSMPWQACKEVPGKSALQVALRSYVKAAVPVPRRFLNVAGSDSGFSETEMKTLVEFGPTYYYVGTEAAKAKLRDKLTTVGPWPALLVVKRGDKKVGSTSEIIRIGGHYVTGEFDGKKATSREYTMTCGADGWTVKDVKEEKGA